MTQHEDMVRLHHMLDAARKGVEFVQNRSRGDLDKDEQLTLSLTHLLEIIGEAAGKVSKEGQGTEEVSRNPLAGNRGYAESSHPRLLRRRLG